MIRKMSLLASAFVIIGVALWAAWQYWPPLLTYRARWALDDARGEVRKYLTGVQPLDTSARRLASELQDWLRLTDRFRPLRPTGPGSLVGETFDLTPAGFSSDDPRIEQLYLRAMIFMIPKDASPAFRERAMQQLDSTADAIRAK